MTKKKISVVSLGCSKNLVDTEIMLGILENKGYQFTFNLKEADILLINTCAFLEAARKEGEKTIIEHLGKYEKLIVTGCLVKFYGRHLLDEFPLINHLISPDEVSKIDQIIAKKPISLLKKKKYPFPRMLTTLSHTTYVKIADGCDNRCSYCLIPNLRGSYRSLPPETIIKEVKNFVKMGIREVNLIAQDTTLYGKDIYGKSMISELLEKLVKTNIYWLRLMYTHPAHFSPALIKTMATYPNICHYLDLPIQHIDDTILQRMNRKISSQQIKILITNLKKAIPDIALRTSIMIGFPGENENMFKKLLDFIEETEFEHLGVFLYSKEPKTRAFHYPNQVPLKIKEKRYHQLMGLQRKISLKKKKEKIGKILEVVVEGFKQNIMFGRSQYEAPEVDGIIYIKGKKVEIGRMIPVKIEIANDYDLIGSSKNV